MDNGEGEGLLEQDDDHVKRLKGDEMCDGDEPQMNFQPIFYLPLEMWNEALGKIQDPTDILSCGDVCYNWHCLLEDKMMPAYHHLILPKLVPFLGIGDLLKCSAISKDWNRLIDTSVMNLRKTVKCWDWDHNRFAFTPVRLPRLYITDGLRRIGNAVVAEIEPYLEAKAEFAGNQFDNPLVYRHVIIGYNPGVEEIADNGANARLEIFCGRLQRFLQRFGKHMYQLELHSQSFFLVQLLNMISICLNHTPNLEVFSCNFREDQWGGNFEDEHLVEPYLAASPLPNSTIQKLQMIRCPMKLTEVVTHRYGNQLVDVDNFAPIPALTLIPKGVTFQNLKVIRSRVYGSTFARFEEWSLDYLTKVVPLLKCTLTEVDVIVDRQLIDPEIKLSFANFLKSLEQHQPQIETLWLSLSRDDVEYNPPDSEDLSGLFSLPPPLIDLELVTLPKLKRLTLGYVGLPPFQVFKRATPVLEYLFIKNKGKYAWTFPSGSTDELWEALPKYKKIRLSNIVKYLHEGQTRRYTLKQIETFERIKIR